MSPKARTLVIVMVAMALLMPTVSTGAEIASEHTAPESTDVDLVTPVFPMVDTGGRFVENLGQWDERAGFVTDTPFGHAVLGTDGVLYDVVGEDGGHRVKVAFEAEGPVAPEGIHDLGYDSNYFRGNDPDLWVRGARSFGEVIYRDVWPGTSIRYHFSGGKLKYDLLLDAEADPSMVRFRVIGAEGLETEGDTLDISLTRGLSIQDRDLVAWYGDGEVVDVSFSRDGDIYGFSVDKEAGRSMVIDPVVVHSSSFIGGTYADTVTDVEVDGEGNIYVLSSTGSDDYPVTTGAYDDEIAQSDAAVTKFNHNCSEIIWSTFIGGSSWDSVAGMELDRNNSVYFAGATWSHDYPCTNGSFNSHFNLGQNNYQMDPFVTKLNSQGNDLDYSTYVGGSHTEWVGDIKVNDGKATVVGQTQSGDFPTEHGSYGGVHGDAFLFTMNENGSRIVDTFFWGGFGTELASCLAFAPNGDIVVGGQTTSIGMFTTPGVFQPTRPCFSSGFISRFTPTTDQMVFSTYFGGSYSTSITDLVLDDDENLYIGGVAYAGSFADRFITTPGAYQEEYHGNWDSFLAKLDPTATRLEYCTLLGGDGKDEVYDLEMDADGHLVAVGNLEVGTNFTVTSDCLDDHWEGETEGFMFVLNDDGSAPVYSTYYGGQQADGVYAVEIDDVDNYVLAGATDSRDFPLKTDGYQQKLSGGSDGFVSIVGELSPTSEPLNLKATGGEGYIGLDWEFPDADGGYPVKRFLLYRGTSEDDLRFYMDLGTINVHVDRDVDWGVYYYYAVYASNGKGISPSSNVDFDRSVTVPDPPFNMTGTVQHSSVVIEWEAPGFSGGLPLTGYIIYRIAQGDHVELVTPITSDVRTYEDHTVEDGTNYTYTMTALNEYGESREPVSVTLRTFDVPTPPMNLSHTYGDLFINLTWEPPMDDFGLPVDGYTVYRRTGEGSPEVVGEVDASDRTFVDTQVTVGTLYNYSISARNGKGESGTSETIEAMPMVPPDRPTGVEAVASEQFVKITWSPPAFDGASPILGYLVYLGDPKGESTCLGGPNTVGIAEPELHFLHDVPYDGVVRSYFVTAQNAEGESPPSEIALSVVFDVPTAPRAMKVVRGDDELTLTWTAPLQDGGTALRTYTVYRGTTSGTDLATLVTLPTGTFRYLDDTVVNGVEYVYSVTATNLAGEGPPSEEAHGIPAGLSHPPSSVAAVSQDGSARLSWQPPSYSGGLPVTGYRVYAVGEGMQIEHLVELGPDVLEFIVDNLDNGDVYLYAFTALTPVGESNRSGLVEARPIGPPSAPVGLVALWMDGHVQLTWSAPLSTGGSPVTGYSIRRDDWEVGNWTDVPDGAMLFRDENVEWEGTYNYNVIAWRDADAGPPATVSLIVPREPGEPPETAPDSNAAYLVVGLVLLVVAASVLLARRRREGEG